MALQRQKSDVLSDVEFERMREERERWGAFFEIMFLWSEFDDNTNTVYISY